MQSKGEALYSITEEQFSRAKLIQLYRAYEKEFTKSERLIDDYAQKVCEKNYFMQNANVFIGVITSFWTVGVLWLGGISVLNETISLGELVSFLSIANLMLPLGSRIGQTILQFPVFTVSIKRFYEIVDEEEIDFEKGDHNLHIKEGRVDFKEVCFRYSDNYVLDNFNLLIQSNSLVLLSGPSGIGKSTILKLIMRFFPIESGQILIDGVDLNEYKEEELKSNIAYLGDYSKCFEGSILENITYGVKDYSLEEVDEILSKVSLEKVIKDLPDGIYTMIGKNGVDLSEGEKQRVALARCFIMKPKILLVDEGTSNLDVDTEMVIYRSLREMSKTCTIISVSHRSEVAKKVDVVVKI